MCVSQCIFSVHTPRKLSYVQYACPENYRKVSYSDFKIKQKFSINVEVIFTVNVCEVVVQICLET